MGTKHPASSPLRQIQHSMELVKSTFTEMYKNAKSVLAK